MSDISKIQLKNEQGNSETYDIKDVIARSHLLYVFNTVADMKSATNLENNTIAKTRGFTEIGKGAGYYYITSEAQTADNIRIFTLQNNLFAILLDNGDLNSYGADSSGNTDVTNIFNVAIANNKKLKLDENGTYLISENIELPSNFVLDGNNSTIKTNTKNIEMLTANEKENIFIKNIIILNSMRGTTFYNCNYIKLDNIKYTTKNWATLFRLCKHVHAENLYFAQPVPTLDEDYNNTDGIHINGLIDGYFKNIYGFTGDDFIALNSDESNANYGPILDVTFENCRTDLNSYYNLNSANSAYRCIRLSAETNNIDNIIFRNCNLMNFRQEVIISTGNKSSKLINNILFENCTFISNINGKFLFSSSSYIGLIKFLNCNIINNSTSSIFNLSYNIDDLIFENITLMDNTTNAHYFLNIGTNTNKVTIKNFFGLKDMTNFNLIITRGTTQQLILDTIDYKSTTNYIAQTNTNANYFGTCIFNNIKKCTQRGILYNNGPVSSTVLASNVDTSFLTVINATVARQIGGTSEKVPTAPQNGDMYLLKSGNTYTQKIYSNGSWT